MLIPAEQRELLLSNGRTSRVEENFDPMPVVKLFTPDAGCTWLLTEIDPSNHFIAFGLCDLGLGMPELGNFSLNEVSGIRGPLGLRVERDLHFVPDKPLSAYAAEAGRAGRIIA
jgi:hypothetical protein